MRADHENPSDSESTAEPATIVLLGFELARHGRHYTARVDGLELRAWHEPEIGRWFGAVSIIGGDDVLAIAQAPEIESVEEALDARLEARARTLAEAASTIGRVRMHAAVAAARRGCSCGKCPPADLDLVRRWGDELLGAMVREEADLEQHRAALSPAEIEDRERWLAHARAIHAEGTKLLEIEGAKRAEAEAGS